MPFMQLKHLLYLIPYRQLLSVELVTVSLQPSIKCTTAFAKNTTKRTRSEFRLVGLDELIDLPHVVRLKMDKAFFRISRSISNCRT